MRRTTSENGWHPVDPPHRPVLLVNLASGNGTAARLDLVERARERGVTVSVVDAAHTLAEAVDSALAYGADALGVAGGDGSLAVVAAAAHASNIPFVCIPAGTRNHFALDLGIDRHDPVGALDAFTTGVERRIDVGRVNGRLFLNNVSLGLYGDAVAQEAYRDAKLRTLADTAREVARGSAVAPDLELLDGDGRSHRRPVVVLVSNNPYALDRPVAQGTRPTLAGGRLGVIVLDAPGSGPPPGRAWTATSFEVGAPSVVHAGIDGEAVELEPPLRFEILPAALRVRIAARHPGASPSGLLP